MIIIKSLYYMINESGVDHIKKIFNSFGYFNNKIINTLNPAVMIAIPYDSPIKAPYISLSTMGASRCDLDCCCDAKYNGQISLLKSLFEGKEAFFEHLDLIIKESEKEKKDNNNKMLTEKIEKKRNYLINKNKEIDKQLYYCEKDKEFFNDIEYKLGVNSDFFKNIFKKNNNNTTLKVPPLTKQLLIFDEIEEEYVSITPISSLVLNKKFIEQINKMKKENFKMNYAEANLGGSKPQNLGLLAGKYGKFRIVAPFPKLKDDEYKKLFKIIKKGFYFKIDKDKINKIIKELKRYKVNRTTKNIDFILQTIYSIYKDSLLNANNLSYFINNMIIKEIKVKKLENINIDNRNYLKFIIENKVISNELFGNLFDNFNSKKENKMLLENRKMYSEEITKQFIDQIKSTLMINNVTLDSEVEMKAYKYIKLEVEK